MKHSRIWIAAAACFLLLIGFVLPFRTEATTVDTGSCGKRITWTLDDGGNLAISGTGSMEQYLSGREIPWYEYRTVIKTVTVSNGITNICDFMLEGAANVTSVTIGSNVTKIGWGAFDGCSSLQAVTLPAALTEIGAAAFRGCSSLTQITIPKNVNLIWDYAFVDCGNLATIDVAEENPHYSSQDGILYNKAKSQVVCCPGGYRGVCQLPDSVTHIYGYSFSGCGQMTDLVLSNILTDIPANAFYNCRALKSIWIPAGVKTVGNWAFADCIALEEVLYGGTDAQWETVAIGQKNDPLKAVTEESEEPEKPVLNGWQQQDGNWYYYKNNTPQTGWQQIGDLWYYLKSNGVMVTGWLNQGGTWYYLKPSGAMATGWLNQGGTWYYLKPSGAMATGWLNQGGTWYYLKPSGAMATGWLNQGGTWYYLKSSGAMATGWLNQGGTWYYLKPSGAMATGWLNQGGTWYYLKPSGAMATGNLWIGGKAYRFASSGAWIA